MKRKNGFQTHDIYPVPKPDKDTTKKEKYKLISLMNKDSKLLKKNQHIKFNNTLKESCT